MFEMSEMITQSKNLSFELAFVTVGTTADICDIRSEFARIYEQDRKFCPVLLVIQASLRDY
jgi:hypothetical protein